MGFVNVGGGSLGRALKVGEDCKPYGAVVMPDGVTSIGDYTFSCCLNLISVTIPDCVMSIGRYAFYNCTSLTSIKIPNVVPSIGEYTFYNCTSLTSVTIPNSVTNIGNGAFMNCISLTSITIPNSVTSIGSQTFKTCSSLTSVTVNAQIISFALSFINCTALTTFNVVTGFNPEYFDLSASPITHDSILSIFNKLATIGTAKTITLGATNLAKMSAAEKLIATNKGWSLA